MKCHNCNSIIEKIELGVITQQPVIYISTNLLYYFCDDICLFNWLERGISE